MKIRNGFVSNSSSSSFIISIPKDKRLRLSEVETYLGGYSSELTDTQKDTLSYFIWKSINRPLPECDREHHEECIATFDEMMALKMKNKCCDEGYYGEWEDHAPQCCKGCKYYKAYDRPARSDDYYAIKENKYIDSDDILSEDKNNYYITIDDNLDPGDYLSYDDAYELRRVSNLFKDTTKVKEV